MVPHHKVALAERGLQQMGARSGAHYTKANHARSTERMCEGGFVVQSQIIFVSYAECWKFMVIAYESR